MKRTLCILCLLGFVASCAAPTQKSKNLVPTGLETARSVGEKTRDAQEKEATGSMYVTSADSTDDGTAESKPEAKSQNAAEASSLVLDIAPDGSVSRNGTPLEKEALQKLLDESPDETRLVLRAPAETPHGRVVGVLDMAHQAGIYQIAFEPRKPEAETEKTQEPSTAPTREKEQENEDPS